MPGEGGGGIDVILRGFELPIHPALFPRRWRAESPAMEDDVQPTPAQHGCGTDQELPIRMCQRTWSGALRAQFPALRFASCPAAA